MAEFPELCGVEQELTDRCVNAELANKFLDLMHRYEESAAIASGSSFDMNPSPGNIKDGLITDAMKSAGTQQKGGTSPVTDILDYPEMSIKSGLNLPEYSPATMWNPPRHWLVLEQISSCLPRDWNAHRKPDSSCHQSF